MAFGHCPEITVYTGCCYFPSVGQLPALWAENRKSLLSMLVEVSFDVVWLGGPRLGSDQTSLKNAISCKCLLPNRWDIIKSKWCVCVYIHRERERHDDDDDDFGQRLRLAGLGFGGSN